MNALTFRLHDQRFACNIANVQSIENKLTISYVPKMPPYVEGFVKQEEEVIPVLDLGHILYDQPTPRGTSRAYIVYRGTPVTIAFYVQAAEQIVTMDESKLSRKSLQTYSQVPYFKAIYDLEDELVTIVDFDELLQSAEGIEDVIEFAQEEMK